MSYKFVPSVAIAICGTITNTLSLSYFSSKVKRGLGNNLLMLLNILDLSVCLSGLIKIAVERQNRSVKIAYKESDNSAELLREYQAWQTVRVIAKFFYRTVVEGTAFVTCVLSVSRTIKFCFVFFKLRKRLVIIAVIGFFIYLVIREIIQAYFQYFVYMNRPLDGYNIELGNWIRGIEIFIVIIILLMSNIMSVIKLTLTKNGTGGMDTEARLKKRATVTVIVLSILFTTFNSMLLTAIVLETIIKTDLSWDFVLWYSVPMNSAVNPIVYIIRIQPMQTHIIRTLLIMKNYILCRGRNTDVISNIHTGSPLSYA